MKIAFITDNIKILKKCTNADILYFGDEFCQNKISQLASVKAAYEFADKNNKQFVFVMPFITDSKIQQADKIFQYLNSLENKIEVIFNDWGIFTLIAKYKNLIPVLGRLLTKQRKDPAAEFIITNSQPKIKVINRNKTQKIIKSKQVPRNLADYFKHSFLEVPEVINFMLLNNIKRYETDMLPWGSKINTLNKIKISIYYPYINISATRYCGAININYTSKCTKICNKQEIIIDNKSKYPYVIKGNAIFYKADEILLNKYIKENKADRIVFNDMEKLNLFYKGTK